MNLSRQAEPIYQQIADQLRNELRQYQAGDRLDGEVSLAQRFQVNRHTVRRALDVLELEGLVKRSQGKGTEVSFSPWQYDISPESAYSDWLTSLGHGNSAQLMSRRFRAATQYEQEHFHVGVKTRVLEVATLRLVQRSPVSIIRHCFTEDNAGLVKDYKCGSMRRFLESKGYQLSRVVSVIGARLATDFEARHLVMTVDKPVLTVQTISKNQHGQIMEISYSTSRADRFQFQVYV